MPINKLQIQSALAHVIHPNVGKDLITLGIIGDIVVQEKFITFELELKEETPDIAQKLRNLCTEAIHRYVDTEAIIYIPIDPANDSPTSTKNEKTSGNAEKTKNEIEQGVNPMNMEDITAGNYVPPTTVDKVVYDDMPELLKSFMDDHCQYEQELDKFEEALIRFKKQQWHMDEEMNKTFGHFFTFLDNEIIKHNRREEQQLFPLLKQRFLESGEHSQKNQYMKTDDDESRTAVDLMEDEHLQLIQLSTLVFNFLGLAHRLPDINSQSVVSDLAFEQGRQIVEILRLHMKREDETLFPLACQLISEEEFAHILNSK